MSLILTAHPATPLNLVQRFEAHASQGADGVLQLRYVLTADMSHLRVPSAQAAARRDELWKHTCFEAFIAEPSGGVYRELNFSPSTEWAMYSFSGYRKGMTPVESAVPQVRVARGPQQLTLEASVRTGLGAGRRLALAAVLEEESGRLSYWALRHPPGKPDFHHPESFVAST